MSRIRDRNETVGFLELAEAIGGTTDDVNVLLVMGQIAYTATKAGDETNPNSENPRKITRADANRYLRKIGRPALPLVTPEKWR